MRTNLTVLLIAAWTLSARAQSPDSGTFLLHKFAQNIGKEKFTRQSTEAGLQYSIEFRFVDRGSPVPLTARLELSQDNEPRSLFIKGKTSRFSTINDSIRISGHSALVRIDDSSYSKDLGPLAFPVAGYSPGTVQMLLLKYWESHGRPAGIPILPAGEVRIRMEGEDVVGNERPIHLNRYVISGLVWGNELVWTRTDGQLVCLITNDAEGDKLEMMLEPYESFLPTLLARAATYGMALFTRALKATPDEGSSGSGFRTAIVGGTLIDVTNGSIIDNSVILVEGGLVKATGRTGELVVPRGYRVIRADGRTILPGLWDMHAHFEQAEWGPAYLAAGVTTVRDCGNEFEYINAIQGAIDSGKGVGPHILKAGIVDGPGDMGLGIIRAATPAEGVAVVKKYKEYGFAQIKIYSSVTPMVLSAICQEAHRQGLTVTGHIPEGMTIVQGIEAGMDMVNHVQYVYSAMTKNDSKGVDVTDSANQRVFRFIREHGTVLDPTVGVFEMVFRNTKDDITRMEPAFYSLPLPLQALFRNMGMPPASAVRYKPVLESMGKIVKAMHDLGIPIVAGTDMGFPGYSLDRELELYVAAGLTPLEAIQTATLIPARVMKLEKVSGTIAAGSRADLIIVDGNPLKQIRDIRQVRTVIKDGQVYDPVKLHEMAGFGK
jgi:imidazolonepropionase-like amidohydrolase